MCTEKNYEQTHKHSVDIFWIVRFFWGFKFSSLYFLVFSILYIYLFIFYFIYFKRSMYNNKNKCYLSILTMSQRRQWHPTPVLLPGESLGWRSLVGCSPWGRWESDTTERLPFHFSLSCIGEGGGSPLQCSCLENPRDRGAWWASVYGVAQSRTRLKRLSSNIIW